MTTTSTSVQLFNHPQLPHLTWFISTIESQFTESFGFDSWNDYISFTSTTPRGALLPVGLEPENLDDPKRAWAEQWLLSKNDDSLNFLSELIYGESFDLEAPELPERFEDLLFHLNLEIESLWNPFVETMLGLNNLLPEHYYENDEDLGEDAPLPEYPATPELIQTFCDHVLVWSYVHDAPLLNPILN
jgi:hypothetical protein